MGIIAKDISDIFLLSRGNFFKLLMKTDESFSGHKTTRSASKNLQNFEFVGGERKSLNVKMQWKFLRRKKNRVWMKFQAFK